MSIWIPSRLTRLDPLLPSSAAAVVASARGWKRKKEKNAGWWLIPATPWLNPVTRRQTGDCAAALKEEEEGIGMMCEPCNGRGWLLCGLCKGQKTNVKAENNKIYRRCPDCRAVGYVVCPKCKVFKCVTYPDFSDGTVDFDLQPEFVPDDVQS